MTDPKPERPDLSLLLDAADGIVRSRPRQLKAIGNAVAWIEHLEAAQQAPLPAEVERLVHRLVDAGEACNDRVVSWVANEAATTLRALARENHRLRVSMVWLRGQSDGD